MSKLSAPMIPFTPLLLKDMTFAHEGNLTFIGKGMINFEKMVRALIFVFQLLKLNFMWIVRDRRCVVQNFSQQLFPYRFCVTGYSLHRVT